MPRIAREQYEQLKAAIRSHDFLQRIVEAIDARHRLVFHANQNANWSLVRESAEQILIADLITRHYGNIDGVYFQLRSLENNGRSWSQAISEAADLMHSYYTTPLGVIMRADLFGEQAVFFTPEAYDWIRRNRDDGAAGRGAAGEREQA